MDEDESLALLAGIFLLVSCVGCVGGTLYYTYYRRDDNYQGLNTV